MFGTLITSGEVAVMTHSSLPEKPLVVLLIGPPGAGKGTHAAPLGQQLHLPHLSTGDLLREHIREKTSLGCTAKQFMDQGQLVPDQLVLEMLFERIAKPDCKEGYILDGFPRTLSQAQALDAALGKTQHLVALNFQVSDTAIIERITGRLVCKQCNKPYHKTFSPPTASNACDGCGGILYQRDDDREELVIKRLEVYRKQTEPVLSYLAQKEGVLREIDASHNKERVYREILETLPVPASTR